MTAGVQEDAEARWRQDGGNRPPGLQDAQADPVGLDGRKAQELLIADRRPAGDLFPVRSIPDVEGEGLDALSVTDVLPDHSDVEELRPAQVVDPGGVMPIFRLSRFPGRMVTVVNGPAPPGPP